MDNRERRNSGVAAVIRVGIVECRNVIGAIEDGTIQEGNACSDFSRERGGCVEGVSINLVLAISSGASRRPAIPAALTAAAKLVKGDGEERTSRPPMLDDIGSK